MSMNKTSVEDRAIELLGQGLGPETVAAAVGVTTSRISQLISDPNLAAKIAELRYTNLAKHNTRDAEYDAIEDKLLERLHDIVPLMYKPSEVLAAVRIINGAKRRGASTPEHITNQQTIVSITIPTTIASTFTRDINNQVVKVMEGETEKDILTIQSGSLNNLSKRLGISNATSDTTNKTIRYSKQ